MLIHPAYVEIVPLRAFVGRWPSRELLASMDLGKAREHVREALASINLAISLQLCRPQVLTEWGRHFCTS